MESQLYMRVRGRVLGPYEPDKLRSLARRGQLSRMHEVSPDGLSWVRAGNFPELFNTVAGDSDSADAGGAGSSSETTVATAPQTRPTQGWYYAIGGAELGPVEFNTLQTLAATGQLGADDMVWTQGMPAWSPARRIQGLAVGPSTITAKKTSDVSADDSAGLSQALQRAAVSSGGWVLFVAISGFVLASLMTFAGVYCLVIGARLGVATLVAGGIFNVLYGIVIAAGALLLATYATRVGKCGYTNDAKLLESALDVLRAFWIYVSIVLIVFLVFLTVLLVWLIAAEVNIPGFDTMLEVGLLELTSESLSSML